MNKETYVQRQKCLTLFQDFWTISSFRVKLPRQWFPRHLAELTARSLLPPNPDDITAFSIVFALLIQHISSFQTLPLQAIFGDNLVMALSVLLWLLLSPTHLVVTSRFDLLARVKLLFDFVPKIVEPIAFTPCSSLLQVGPDLIWLWSRPIRRQLISASLWSVLSSSLSLPLHRQGHPSWSAASPSSSLSLPVPRAPPPFPAFVFPSEFARHQDSHHKVILEPYRLTTTAMFDHQLRLLYQWSSLKKCYQAV